MSDCDECANYKPKRKQTGWVCRRCQLGEFGPCVRITCCPYVPYAGPYECTNYAVWVPFYGKVVE